MLRTTVILIAAAVLGAAPALASTVEPDAVTGTVRVGDLDFTDASNVKQFERRLRQRARSLCSVGGKVDLTLRIAAEECRTRVIASGQVKLPQLVAEARSRSAPRLALR